MNNPYKNWDAVKYLARDRIANLYQEKIRVNVWDNIQVNVWYRLRFNVWDQVWTQTRTHVFAEMIRELNNE